MRKNLEKTHKTNNQEALSIIVSVKKLFQRYLFYRFSSDPPVYYRLKTFLILKYPISLIGNIMLLRYVFLGSYGL